MNAVVWMVLSSWNSHAGILMFQVILIGGGAFGSWLGHEGCILMNVISALIKETSESLIALPGCEDKSRCHWAWTRKRALTRICHHLDLELPSLQNCEKEMLFKLLSLCVCLVICFVYSNPSGLNQRLKKEKRLMLSRDWK